MNTTTKLITLLSFCSLQLWAENSLKVNTVKNKNLNLLDSMLESSEKEKQEQKPSFKSDLGFNLPAPKAKFIGTSLVLQTAAGASTTTDTEIGQLQTGFHDPARRGFTFQAGEVSLSGMVDPYFKAEMHANFSESAVELEEAFLTTTNLPYHLELEVGYFLTEFGRNNPRHAHDREFVDQPLTVGRIFGGEGQRATGFRLAGLLPTPWLSEIHLGLQSPEGGLTSSFRTSSSTTVADRPTVTRETHSMEDMIALLRFVNGWRLGRNWESQLGLSTLTGPNSTSEDANTRIFGADLVLNWVSPKQRQGYPFVRFEAEATHRTFEAAAGTSNGLAYQAEDLEDWAYLVQGTYGFAPRWIAGLRYEQAGGEGASFTTTRALDPDRSDRTRISPVLTYKPSEFSKVSLQYNYDKVDFLTDNSHSSLWLSFQVLIGTHPAHNF